MTNYAAEPAMRIPVLERKNYPFAGSDQGGVCAAAFYTLIGAAKLDGIDPETWLPDVASRLDDLLPGNWRPIQPHNAA
jgi:hypothetical protein